MVLIINNRTFLLNDNSSWRIRPGVDKEEEGIICITRLECNKNFYTPKLGDNKFAEDIAELISNEIVKGSKIIEVKTSINTEIKIQGWVII